MPTATPYTSRMKEFTGPIAKKAKFEVRFNLQNTSKCMEPTKSMEPKKEEQINSNRNRKYPSYKRPTLVKKSPPSSPEEEKKKHVDPKTFVIPKPSAPLPRPEELFTVRKRGTV